MTITNRVEAGDEAFVPDPSRTHKGVFFFSWSAFTASCGVRYPTNKLPILAPKTRGWGLSPHSAPASRRDVKVWTRGSIVCQGFGMPREPAHEQAEIICVVGLGWPSDVSNIVTRQSVLFVVLFVGNPLGVLVWSLTQHCYQGRQLVDNNQP